MSTILVSGILLYRFPSRACLCVRIAVTFLEPFAMSAAILPHSITSYLPNTPP